MKPINDSYQHEFHEWGRKALGSVIVQDIDAFAIVASRPTTYEPAAIIELKRSTIEPGEWLPFDADRRNYAALLELARRARVPLYVVYYEKGKTITSSSLFAVFLFEQAVPEYRYRRKVMSSDDFAKHFSELFTDVALPGGCFLCKTALKPHELPEGVCDGCLKAAVLA